MGQYQSPISPGISWYEASCGDRPTYPALDGDVRCDAVIIGGGFCGLTAALTLAKTGASVVLLEQHRLGDGASGRNGGQLGTGPRDSVLDLENDLGFERAKALFDLAERAKASLLDTAQAEGIETDFMPGQLTALHKRRYEKEVQEEVDALNTRYGYGAIEWLDRDAMASALGSDHYPGGGTRDTGTGHIHPMKTVIGLGKAAARAGVRVCENSPATRVERDGGLVRVETPTGTVRADKCLMALNAYHDDIHDRLAHKVMPIQSFIAATVPLGHNAPVIPGGEAVDDSRFVVRYFRKTKDNRLLFGGREAYGDATPANIRRVIGKQIAELYPDLKDIELTHAWGGNVGITMPRRPYVRELEPGIWTAGGFSGHGVMLSNYTGRLIAEHWAGESEDVRLLMDLKVPSFPGGPYFRSALKQLALSWYALVDRF